VRLQVQPDEKTLDSMDIAFGRASGMLDNLRSYVTATVAAAIARERERCAKIAETYGGEYSPSCSCSGEIAERIRSGE
jgi:hypothetical protein